MLAGYPLEPRRSAGDLAPGSARRPPTDRGLLRAVSRGRLIALLLATPAHGRRRLRPRAGGFQECRAPWSQIISWTSPYPSEAVGSRRRLFACRPRSSCAKCNNSAVVDDYVLVVDVRLATRALRDRTERGRDAGLSTEAGLATPLGGGCSCSTEERGGEARLVVDTMVGMYRLGVAPDLLFGLGWRVPRI